MVKIGMAEPAIGAPIPHLIACHRRIEERLATLERASEHLQRNREAALEAIRSCIRFLDSNGALHTEDEEVSLFPRLRPRLSAEQCEYLDSLEAQHRAGEAVYSDLKLLVRELESVPEAHEEVFDRYAGLTQKLSALYRPHIQSEDEILTKLAETALDEQTLALIKLEMRQRRTR